MENIRFGIVGMGVQGTLYANILSNAIIPHMPTIGKPEGCTLTAVSSRSSSAEEFASRLPNVTYFANWKEMIDSDLCDAIVITVPHYLHHEVAIYALAHGKHVLCEKPAGIRASDVKEMIKVRNENGNLALATLFNQRTRPLYQKLKEIIDSHELGEIRRSNWICNNWWRPDSYYQSSDWRATWNGEGGGITVNQIPHQLDLWLTLCGEPHRVYSVNKYGCHRDIVVDNDVTITAEYPNGATGVFVACTHDPLGTDRLEIDFEKGKIVAENGTSATIYRFNQTEEQWNKTYSMKEMAMLNRIPGKLYDMEKLSLTPVSGAEYVAIFKNFANHILNGEPLIATMEDGLKEVQLANSIQLSGLTKEAVAHPSSEKAYNELLQNLISKETNQ